MNMISTVVAALYGGSENRAPLRVARPAQIVSCLRRSATKESELSWNEVIESLQREDFSREAIFLSDEANQNSAYNLIEEGRVITLGCDCYPNFLISTMGANAPPIFWISDPSLRKIQPWNNNDGSQRVCVAAVGCRTPPTIGLSIASEVGLWTATSGFLSVSGGALGCDSAFGKAAFNAGGEVVNLLPHGINHMSEDQWGYGMTVCPPKEEFSSGRAMERNALIYAFSHMTVVCSTRYRQGGSWQGAASAIKANRPVVVADWTSTGLASTIEEEAKGTYAQAQRTLANLGAHPLVLDTQSYQTQIQPALHEALDWSLGKLAGTINSGLFSA